MGTFLTTLGGKIVLAIVVIAVGIGALIVIPKLSNNPKQLPEKTTTVENQTSTISPTPQTEGWKTYKNDKLKLQFQYPPEFGDVQETSQNGAYAMVFTNSGNKLASRISIQAMVQDQSNTSFKSKQEKVSSLLKENAGYDCSGEKGLINNPNPQIDLSYNCEVVEVKGAKGLKVSSTAKRVEGIEGDPSALTNLQIFYLFPHSDKWFSFISTYGLSKAGMTVDQIKNDNSLTEVKNNINTFEKLVSTVIFTD